MHGVHEIYKSKLQLIPIYNYNFLHREEIIINIEVVYF